jgi:predicted nucleic acid-binding protein
VIVVDTNVVAALFLGTDATPAAEALLQSDGDWAAPLLWRSEFRSVLTGMLRRGRLDAAGARRVASEAEALLRRGEYTVESGHVLDLVARSRCSAYDCEFVALAEDLGVSLVTDDREVLEGFPEIARGLRA